MNRKVIENIIGQLRDVQNGITWYDDNFEKKIEPISEEQAFRRPIPEIHSVAELISHIKQISIKVTGNWSHFLRTKMIPILRIIRMKGNTL